MDSGIGYQQVISKMHSEVRDCPQAAWLCFVCGADFRYWVDLPHEVRMAFLMKHREFKIERLLEDRCPRCDAPLTATAQGPESATTLHVH